MRLVLATDWYLPRLGGVELHIADLAKALRAAGADATVVTTTPGGDGGEIPVRRLQSLRLSPFDLAISPRLVATLEAAFKTGGFDLVHAHISVVSPVGYGAVLAAHRLDLPTVVSFCGVLLRSAQFLRVMDRLTGWTRWPLSVTAVSSPIAAQLRAALPGLDVGILPNGVDVGFWRASTKPMPRPAGEIIAVTAMRLTRKKRPEAMLRAFFRAHDAAARQGRRLVLRIAGDGPLRVMLERYVEAQGVAADVEFLGAVPRNILTQLYRRADLFLLPSVHESFGIAALEARCAGLPVIGMRAAGIVDFLRDGETGLLAADDDAFARHFQRLALDDELRGRLARADPDLTRFDWPEVAKAHLACYEQARKLAAR
ncbi:MAG TPA: glycosyltransferase family 4 protein [Stellaceae bacterium]|jgi:glycosyltransferase involved in cell wall biosynthesis